MKIHSTAIVDARAELADDVEVQPYTIIGPQVRIGAGTVVGPHCVLDGRTVIGENNRIFSGAQIGVLCQDLKHHPDMTGRCIIGDNNQIREHVTISASSMESAEDDERATSLGSDCLLMAYAHIAHDCHVGDSVIMANSATLAGHVDIESYVTLSGLVAVHQFCAVGMYAFVGGLSRVTMDVLPYMMVEGNPPHCYGPNSVGLRRRGFDNDARARIKQMYKIMFRSDLNTTQALNTIEATIADSPERTHFLEFVRKSVRGVTK
ncbi:MAG: acyl-ACP--UDP-N-acetylglucosamine O-acyltransferase [FCB group bacterium]|jgi:UDP-N-acetylglucosamine acyltransferase|nr:acyl-ACP--UDP-N-acetylglucosamine O-acyltransferase [FCB group bacterium]